MRLNKVDRMTEEFLDVLKEIADDMGSMAPDVRWCIPELEALMYESAQRQRTARTVCTMAHIVMAKKLGTGGLTDRFIDEISARVAAAYEAMTCNRSGR